jgi:hypothetical protein
VRAASSQARYIKVVTLLFTQSMDELTSEEKTKIVKHIATLHFSINTIALGKPEKPGHWKCPIKDGQEVGDCSFKDVHAKKVEMKLPLIIAKALILERSKAHQLSTMVKDLEWILMMLQQNADFTNNKIDIIEQKIHLWSVKWIAAVGKESMTVRSGALR